MTVLIRKKRKLDETVRGDLHHREKEHAMISGYTIRTGLVRIRSLLEVRQHLDLTVTNGTNISVV